MDWEQIDNNLFRTIIQGGWLVKIENELKSFSIEGNQTPSICFVPDIEHDWIVFKNGD